MGYKQGGARSKDGVREGNSLPEDYIHSGKVVRVSALTYERLKRHAKELHIPIGRVVTRLMEEFYNES
jgi:hypothetical protein